jgi:hypothetical protein
VRGIFLGFSTADLGPEGLKEDEGGGGGRSSAVELGLGLGLGAEKVQSRDQ